MIYQNMIQYIPILTACTSLYVSFTRVFLQIFFTSFKGLLEKNLHFWGKRNIPEGTFRHFWKRYATLARTLRSRSFFSNRYILIPFRSVLGVLTRKQSLPLRNVLDVFSQECSIPVPSQERFHPPFKGGEQLVDLKN